MKKVKIELSMLKEPDLWWEVREKLALSDDLFYYYFEYGDYGAFEIEIDEKLNIIGGKFIPCGNDKQ